MDGKQLKARLNLNDLFLAEVTEMANSSRLLPWRSTSSQRYPNYGAIEHVNELLDQFPKGLKNVEEKFKVQGRSSLCGSVKQLWPNWKTLKETNFRLRYDAAIIGVQGGQPQKERL